MTLRKAALGLVRAGLAIALLAACSQPPGEVAVPLGSLSGRARLEGVYTGQGTITLRLSGPGGEHVTQTDARGNYAFGEIPAGTYMLSASRERYFPLSLTEVRVAPEATLPLLTLKNHRPLITLHGLHDPERLKEAEDPEFGGMVPTQSPFLTNLTLSPDGRRLAFIHGGSIKSIRLDGTDLRSERSLPGGFHADWVDWGKSGFLLRGQTGSASASIMLLTPQGREDLVPAGTDELFAPVFSPDETQVAYVRYDPQSKSPQLMRIASSGGTPVLMMDMLDRLNLRGIWDGTFGMMFAPLEWRPEGLMFHAPMTCNLERNGFTLGKDGIYVLRDPLAPDTSGGLHKAHFYSYYTHAFSHDGKRMLYGYGPEIRSKRLDEPNVSAPGEAVGYHSDEAFEALTPSPEGDRLFYLTPSGIEEMQLLH